MKQDKRMKTLKGEDGGVGNITIKTNVPEKLGIELSQCKLINAKQKKIGLPKHSEKKNLKAHSNKIVPVNKRVSSTKRNKCSNLFDDVDDINENSKTEASVPEQLESHASMGQVVKTKDIHREFGIDGLGNSKSKIKEYRAVPSMSTRSRKSLSTQNRISEDEETLKTNNLSDLHSTHKIQSEHFYVERKPYLSKSSRMSVQSTSFKCHLCPGVYKCNGTLKAHLKIHSKKHQCEQCGICCISNSSLVIHHKTHTGEKSYTCRLCQKSFPRKDNLNRHILVHTREKRYACNICTKTFSLQGNLNRHTLVHTGEKEHMCEFCHKRFAERSNLYQHMRTHTKEKPYACSLCTKTFSLQSNLNTHSLVHSGEKKHICGFCQKQFTLFGNLVKHIRTHIREKPYGCDKCSKTFSQSAHLKYHKTHLHNI